MPVKYPCTNCKKACKECKEEGQESICCDRCLNWVHFRCTNESRDTLINPDFIYTCDRCYRTSPVCDKLCRKKQKSIPCDSCKFQHHVKCILASIPAQQTFNCQTCKNSSAEPSPNGTNQNISISTELNNVETESLDTISRSLNSSDFEFESDTDDYETRGLNFDILPFGGNLAPTKRGSPNLFNNFLPKRTRQYKYPCLVCHSVCCKNQNCICCTLCDEWVHLKCTDLTVSKFNSYTDKDNSEPYYCTA